MSNGYVQWKHNKDDEWSNLASSEELTGIKGDTGAQGPKGDTGETGVQGPKGDTGAIGAQGVKRDTGPKGADGETIKIRKTATSIEWSYVDKDEWTSIIDIADLKGEKGDKGDKGDTGIQGIQGVQGIPGIVGPKGDTGAQGAQGIQGVKGDKGDTGPSNNLTVGTVATGNPGVSITGTSPNQTINFTFPNIPVGGSIGQILMKNSNNNYDTK